MNEKFSPEEWAACLKVLRVLKDDPFDNPDNETFKTLVTAISKQAKKQGRKENSTQRRAEDAELLSQTFIVSRARAKTTPHVPLETQPVETQTLHKARKCYVCDKDYTQLHFFYHKLCPECATRNYTERSRVHDLRGYTVLITGGRVKIGYAAVLAFLRAGAEVLLTTRFPALALEQLQQEKDYDEWKDRLQLYGLDLRNLKAVQEFTDYCTQHLNQLDILVNNAAQTIKYPFSYYEPLLRKEQQLLLNKPQNLFPNLTALGAEQAYLLPGTSIPEVALNRFGQPVDYRDKNSWNSTLEEIGLEELLEVNLINHISPYRLISELKPLMLRSTNRERFIINVTSSEGQFSYANKTLHHPHTNMTKAALNMLTRTSAQEFVKDNIYMTAVDVGWVSTGAVESKREHQFEKLRIPPLDPLDGAMRILHPIGEVREGNTQLYGVLLKDYKVVNW